MTCMATTQQNGPSPGGIKFTILQYMNLAPEEKIF